MTEAVRAELAEQGLAADSLRLRSKLHLRYAGTDSALEVAFDGDFVKARAEFEAFTKSLLMNYRRQPARADPPLARCLRVKKVEPGSLADRILLVLAYDGAEPIAGALNFIGADALYGRYWGCTRDKPFLHFELCYYQAIDAAIRLGLGRVEAGAQGGHKLARGYEPVRTWSAHWIANAGFRQAVADFLEREREGIAQDQLYLGQHTPFRKG